MKSNKTIILVIALVVLGVGGYFGFVSRTPFPEKKPAVGEAAPAIALADPSGKMVTLADYRGKVVLVNFWASWCPPCTNEMPGFEKAFENFESRGFVVIGIAIDDVKMSLIRDLRITYPVAKASDRVTKDYGGVSGVPQSFLIGRDGRIVKKLSQYYSEDELRADVEAVLKAH